MGAPNHESWVAPAGVSSALAVLGGEIPSRIDSSTIWGGGGGNCGRINLFACEGGGVFTFACTAWWRVYIYCVWLCLGSREYWLFDLTLRE